MSEHVDARGLSCPQPVLLALSKMREVGTGEIEVLVDNEVSKENVSRAAAKEGWALSSIDQQADEFRLHLKR